MGKNNSRIERYSDLKQAILETKLKTQQLIDSNASDPDNRLLQDIIQMQEDCLRKIHFLEKPPILRREPW